MVLFQCRYVSIHKLTALFVACVRKDDVVTVTCKEPVWVTFVYNSLVHAVEDHVGNDARQSSALRHTEVILACLELFFALIACAEALVIHPCEAVVFDLLLLLVSAPVVLVVIQVHDVLLETIRVQICLKDPLDLMVVRKSSLRRNISEAFQYHVMVDDVEEFLDVTLGYIDMLASMIIGELPQPDDRIISVRCVVLLAVILALWAVRKDFPMQMLVQHRA